MTSIEYTQIIEDMANIIIQNNKCPTECLECEYNSNIGRECCIAENQARALYKYGYRKIKGEDV